MGSQVAMKNHQNYEGRTIFDGKGTKIDFVSIRCPTSMEPLFNPLKNALVIMGSRVAMKNRQNYEGRTFFDGKGTENILCEELMSHIHGTVVQLTQNARCDNGFSGHHEELPKLQGKNRL